MDKKTTKITIRITEEEKGILDAEMKETGLTISEILRKKIHNRLVVRKRNSEIEKIKIYIANKTFNMLKNTANNINQIAKKLNSGEQVNNITEELETLKADIEKVKNFIKGIV